MNNCDPKTPKRPTLTLVSQEQTRAWEDQEKASDWEPGPEHCDPGWLLRDAKTAGRRTILDLYPDEREEMLKVLAKAFP